MSSTKTPGKFTPEQRTNWRGLQRRAKASTKGRKFTAVPGWRAGTGPKTTAQTRARRRHFEGRRYEGDRWTR